MKTAKIYETLKTVLGQEGEENHTVEVRLFAVEHKASEELFHEVWIDGKLVATSQEYDNEQRAYVEGRKAWRQAITDVLNEHWPLPS